MIKHALKYAQQGFRILPVKLNKTPYALHGHKDASCDEQQIMKWWSAYPNANIGLALTKLSGICALDIDPRHGGTETFRKLIETFGPLPITVEAITGGGGSHFCFERNENFSLPAQFKDKGIDLKKNGYIIVSPSIHESGNKYEWVKGRALGEIKLAPLPDFLLSNSKENKTSLKDLYKGVDEGWRNDALARLAGSLANDGVPLEECISFAISWNNQNNPPLSTDEIERTVKSIYSRHLKEAAEVFKEKVQVNPPEELCHFLKRDIPPVEYFIKDIIQKNGRTMISAPTNVGKSVLVQNIAIALIWERIIWDHFEILPARVLYLDCEMGESLLKDRFQKMVNAEFIEPEGLFVKSIFGMNILDKETQDNLEQWINDLKINVLILDPIGSAWQGDENKKEEVSKVTSYLDTLIGRLSISIVIVHHWRKPTRDSKTGGEMASGSYKWAAWADIHITLNGIAENLAVECHKARASQRFPPFRIKLNPQTMKFDYLGDFTKKYTDETLINLFEAFNQDRVAVPEIIKRAQELKMGSEETIRNLIKETKSFRVDKSGKAHYLERVAVNIPTAPISELKGIG